VIALASFGGIGRLWDSAEASGGFGLLVTSSVLFHLAVALPLVVGGIFLLRFTQVARYIMVVVCAVNLLNPPFGSILGGYGLWVLMMPETEPLFTDPLLRRNRTSVHPR
jgi:hypothetical protein